MPAPDESRPVLVTGGAGFAGGYVIRALIDAGCDVVVCDSNDYRMETRFIIGEDAAERIPFERGSIDQWAWVLDVVSRHRPSAILHLAAARDFRLLDRNPLAALKINLEGTVNFLEAGRFFDVQRFIYFSTIGVIPQVKYEPIDAEHPVILPRRGPVGAYSVAKLCGEAFSFTYLESFGLDIRILRPSALYGFGMSGSPRHMKEIVEPAVRGEPVRLPSGGLVPRDYTHILDLASLVMSLLHGDDEADRIFYAATGEPLRTGADVAEIVRELVPGADVEIGEEWTESDRAELACRGKISIDNAHKQLGWSPRYARLEEGISEYIGRYRTYLPAQAGSG